MLNRTYFFLFALLMGSSACSQDREKVIEYYDTDTVKTVGYLVDNQKDGEWKHYHENGALKSRVIYTKGKELERNNFSPEGLQRYRKVYYEGSKFCEWKYYEKSGRVKEQICYENHQRTDTSLTYYETGVVKQQWIFKNGKMNGEFTLFYDVGRPQEKAMYVDGKQEGYYIKYYYNGNMELRKNMKDGMMVDSCFYYYPTGQVSASMYFNDEGNMEGEYLTYFRSGQMKSRGFYLGHDNLMDGDFVTYYENGEKETVGEYDEGEKVGTWRFWTSKGLLTQEIDYGKAGKSFYVRYNYDSSGKLISKEKVEE